MSIHLASHIMSQNFAAKANAINSHKQQHALMNNVASIAYASNMPQDIRAKMLTAVQSGRENADRQLRSETTFNAIPVDQQISALKVAPLAEKRNLLNLLPIIPVPVGAAFLGATESDLYNFNSQNCGTFGGIYLRRRCNSMNELLLIAQNPGWLRYRPHGSPALVLPDSKMLYAFAYVDISTAMAYTNMS